MKIKPYICTTIGDTKQREDIVMKEYKPIVSHTETTVGEPAVSYNYLAENKGVTEYSGQIMDMLLRQTPQIKLMIINKLSESLMEAIPTDAPAQNTVETDIKVMEEKQKYYQRKYNLSEDLSKLIGIVPASSVDEDWKQAKEDYLREKYGV